MNARRILLVMFSFFLVIGMAFAQRTFTQGQKKPGQAYSYTLTIISPVRDAAIFIDGTRIKGNAVKLNGNQSYDVTVRADGYEDFSTTVNLTQDTVIRANLKRGGGGRLDAPQTFNPSNVQLAVTANVGRAQVFLNGSPVGMAPLRLTLQRGNYTIVVKADGFADYAASVNLGDSPVTIAAILQPLTVPLTVQSNVPGAAVFINGAQVGTTPFSGAYPPGSYSVVIRVPGFIDFSAAVSLGQPQTVSAVLMPATATLRLELAPEYGFHGNSRNLDKNRSKGKDDETAFGFYIDGTPQFSDTVQVLAGTHRILVVTGDMRAEVQASFEAGKVYIIRPAMTLTIRQ